MIDEGITGEQQTRSLGAYETEKPSVLTRGIDMPICFHVQSEITHSFTLHFLGHSPLPLAIHPLCTPNLPIYTPHTRAQCPRLYAPLITIPKLRLANTNQILPFLACNTLLALLRPQVLNFIVSIHVLVPNRPRHRLRMCDRKEAVPEWCAATSGGAAGVATNVDVSGTCVDDLVFFFVARRVACPLHVVGRKRW